MSVHKVILEEKEKKLPTNPPLLNLQWNGKHTLIGEVGALPLCVLGGTSDALAGRDAASERSRGR